MIHACVMSEGLVYKNPSEQFGISMSTNLPHLLKESAEIRIILHYYNGESFATNFKRDRLDLFFSHFIQLPQGEQLKVM